MREATPFEEKPTFLICDNDKRYGSLFERVGLVLGERQLIRVLKEYVSHFNPARPHQGIAQSIPAPRVLAPGTPKTSRVIAGPVLNGLHHDYRWAA